jgi:photosystem II stability/assembly factor-like uncharacterized protein
MNRFISILMIGLVIFGLVGCQPKAPEGVWTPIPFPDGKQNTIFELNFLTPEVGWLTGWSDKGPKETDGWEILQTRDGGKSWNVMAKQLEQKIQYVYFINEKTGWALNLTHDILQTTDGGETWTIQRPAGKAKVKYFYENPSAPTEIPEPLNRIYFLNEQSGWAWGGGNKKENEFEQEGIFLRTDDGGKNWQKSEFPFGNELKTVYFLDNKNGWAADTKAGLYNSVNGGRSWEKRPDDMKRPSINGVFFLNKDRGWIVGDRYVGVTEDGGRNFTRVRVDRSYLYDIWFADENNGWAVGDNNTILRSEDGGRRWQAQTSGFDSPVTITKLKFFNNKTGWAAGHNGALLRYDAK